LFELLDVFITFSGSESTFIVFKTDIGKSLLAVVWVEGNFKTLDFTILVKFGFKVRVVEGLVSNSLVKDVVVDEFLFVTSEKGVVEWKSTALEFLTWLITLDLEVSHFIASFLVESLIWDTDDG
jgi:hypothetical protein